MNVNIQYHLNFNKRVNLGSYYTPHKYVMLIRDWLVEYGLTKNNVILDSSCGYGAFFELQQFFPNNRFVGNDIDRLAIRYVPLMFPHVRIFKKNALHCVSRKQYGIDIHDKLIIVGNPPYNDITSQINNNVKTKEAFTIDKDIRTRDLGLSSLLSYDKLSADYVAVLHPLSYLVKKSNFFAAGNFFGNYRIVEHLVFSSQEFKDTSRSAAFPVIAALYRRTPFDGLCYDDVFSMTFKTVEGEKFSLSQWDYVSDFIEKYPHRKRFKNEILFYALRDINALKRSRTFISKRCLNAVDVDPNKLAYYSYLDCFKRYANVPYYMGNLDVPFCKDKFSQIKNDVLAVSKYRNQDIFGASPTLEGETEKKVIDYIDQVLRSN